MVAVNEAQPDTLVAFKSGPPLIVGVGSDDMYVASDVQALVPYTKKVVFLDDGEIVEIKDRNYRILSGQGRVLDKPVREINWTADAASKSGFSHFMLKE